MHLYLSIMLLLSSYTKSPMNDKKSAIPNNKKPTQIIKGSPIGLEIKTRERCSQSEIDQKGLNKVIRNPNHM